MFLKRIQPFPQLNQPSRGVLERSTSYPVLICFYGVANENAAKITGASEEDMQKLLKAIWSGTKNLVTRSKMEHNSKLLLRMIYKEGLHWHIGELDSHLKLVSEVEEKSIRDVSQICVDITDLLNKLNHHKDKVEKIEHKEDGRLKFTANGTHRFVQHIEEH